LSQITIKYYIMKTFLQHQTISKIAQILIYKNEPFSVSAYNTITGFVNDEYYSIEVKGNGEAVVFEPVTESDMKWLSLPVTKIDSHVAHFETFNS